MSQKIIHSFFVLLLICFSSSALHAQNKEDIKFDENDWFENGRPEHIYEYDELGIRRLPAKIGSRSSSTLVNVGSPKIPVLLVQFPDRSFYAAGKTNEEVRNSYELFFNGLDAAEVKNATGSWGSVKQYFQDQSLGLFSPEFVIIGPVTLDSNYYFYGGNSSSSRDININKFYAESLSKSVNECHVDWNIFDNNGDGILDMMFFVHSGWGENVAHDLDKDAIWAKESTTNKTVKDMEGNSYVFGCSAVCAEARNKESVDRYIPEKMRMDGIGVCVHEFSHALGLPDFYDTRNVAFGMDLWSIMDYGEYGNNGYTPGNYTAYERDFMGWQPLIEISDTTILSLSCFADGGQGYKIVNEANEDEYYIIENRQPKGWDQKICGIGKGLQVTHVDYNASRWSSNSVNTDANHQRMTIIAANNSYLGTNSATSSEQWKQSLSGNLFPYTQPSQSLTNTSVPNEEVYAGVTLNKPLFDITQNEDSTINVYYLKSKADYEKEFADAMSKITGTDMLDVYAMNGVHICRCQRDELHRISFHHGIYVVRFPNGTVRKVLLK